MRGSKGLRSEGVASMPSVFYFYEADGREEIAGHPLNGITATGCGAGLDTSGRSLSSATAGPKWEDSRGRFARYEIWGRRGRGPIKRITIEDFPGKRHVLVKFWTPAEAGFRPEWFYLVPEKNRLNSPS